MTANLIFAKPMVPLFAGLDNEDIAAARNALHALFEHLAALDPPPTAPLPHGPVTGLLDASRELRRALCAQWQERECGSAPSPNPPPELMTRQLERFSRDLRLLRSERNHARTALSRARLDALQRLAAAAELKDNDTGEHVIRMGHFSALIARALGRDAAYCETLLHASRMHDIGKIGIPDSILKKPGKLTDEEWLVMRTHPQIGAALLSDTDDPLYNMAEEVARCHHEKFDGTGYPSALRGEVIPLSARIVALADYFDALTMNRCYRPAMPDEQVLGMIRDASGSHFDPQVVAAFFRALPDIIDARSRVNRGELN